MKRREVEIKEGYTKTKTNGALQVYPKRVRVIVYEVEDFIAELKILEVVPAAEAEQVITTIRFKSYNETRKQSVIK